MSNRMAMFALLLIVVLIGIVGAMGVENWKTQRLIHNPQTFAFESPFRYIGITDVWTPVGGSMAPCISMGDSVATSVLDIETLVVGDLVVFTVPNAPVDFPFLHRVILIDSDEEGWFIRARGDANTGADPYKVREEDIEGVVHIVFHP